MPSLLQEFCLKSIEYIIAILLFCVIYKIIFIKYDISKNKIVGICFIVFSIIIHSYYFNYYTDYYFNINWNIYIFNSILSKIFAIIGVSFLRSISKKTLLNKKYIYYIILIINTTLMISIIYFNNVSSNVLYYLYHISYGDIPAFLTIVIDILFISTLFILSIIMYKPKQILYICPHCGAYTTVLQENIKNANPQCSFCKTDRILLNEKPTKDKRKFENYIFTTYLKNYPQFDEKLYLERISKEQSK